MQHECRKTFELTRRVDLCGSRSSLLGRINNESDPPGGGINYFLLQTKEMANSQVHCAPLRDNSAHDAGYAIFVAEYRNLR